MKIGIFIRTNLNTAKKMFELCNENKINERCLNYLIKQTKTGITHKQLLNLLLLKWSDRRQIMTSAEKRQTFDNRMVEQNGLSHEKNTIFIDLFVQMAANKRLMVRKLAAYTLL